MTSISYTKVPEDLLGLSTVVILVWAAILIAIGIVGIISFWRLYRKAGEHGWGAIVPFYNSYLLYKIVWGNGWWFLTLLIPFGGWIMLVATYIKLAKCYGKGTGFGIGLLFISVILLPIMAFGDSKYQGSHPNGRVGCLIASIVTGVLSLVVMIVVVGLSVSKAMQDYNSIYSDEEYDWSMDYDDSLQGGFADLGENTETEGDSSKSVENLSDFEYVTLDNGNTRVSVPFLNNESSYVGNAFLQWTDEGISATCELSYYTDVEVADLASDVISSYTDMVQGIEGYSNFKESDAVVEDGLVVKLLQYTYTYGDGTAYDNYEVVKVEDIEGYNLITELGVNTEYASEMAITNALSVYGISIK